MSISVGELYATFRLDSASVTAAVGGLEKQFAGLGAALGGLGLTRMVTRPLVDLGKDIFETGISFESTMSRVQALSQATEESFEQLRQKALEVGASTSKTAQQAAEGMTILAMAGFKDQQISDLIGPVVQLAEIAGTDDMSRLAGYIADTAMAFSGGRPDDAARLSQSVVDLFAASVTGADLSVDDLGEGLAKIGPIAASMGYEMTDMAAALALMSDYGLKGSAAGNSLKRVILNMSKSNVKLVSYMEEHGIRLFEEGTGKARSFRDVLEDLRNVSKDMSDQDRLKFTQTLAGTYGMAALSDLIDIDDETYRNTLSRIDNAYREGGTAARMSALMLDNLQGRITLLNSALETSKIDLASILAVPAEGIIGGLQEMVNGFNGLDMTMKRGALDLGVFAASLGPVSLGLAGVMNLLPGLSAMLVGMTGPLGLAVTSVMGLSAAFLNRENGMGLALEAGAEALGGKLRELSGTLVQMGPELKENFVSFFDSVSRGVSGALPPFFDLVLQGLETGMQTAAAGMEKVGDTLYAAALGMVNSISGRLPEITGALGGLAVSALSYTLSHLPDLTGAFGGLVQGLIQAAGETDWAGLGRQLSDSLLQGLTGLGNMAGKIGDNLQKELTSGFSRLQLDAGKIRLRLKNAGAFLEKLTAALLSAAGKQLQVLPGILDQLFQRENWEAAGAGMAGVVESLVNGLETGLMGLEEAGKQIVAGAGSLLSSLLGSLDALFQGIGDKNLTGRVGEILGRVFQGLTETVVKDLGEVLPGAVSALSSLGQILGDAVLTGLSGIEGAAGTVCAALTEALSSFDFDAAAVQVRIQGAGEFLEKLTRGLFGAADAVLTGAQAFADQVTGMLSREDLWAGAGEALKGTGESLMKALSEGMASLGASASGLALSILQAIQSGLSALDGAGIGEAAAGFTGSLIQSLSESLQAEKLARGVTEAAGKLASTLLDAMTGAVQGLNGSGIADAMSGLLRGLVTGLENALPEAAASLQGFAGSLVSLLSGALGAAGKNGFPEAAGRFAGDLLKTLGDALSQLDAGALARSLTETAGHLMSGLIRALQTALSGAGTTVRNTAGELLKGLVQGLREGLAGALPEMAEAAAGLLGSLSELFTGEKATGALTGGARGLASSLISALSSAFQALTGAGAELASGLMDALSSGLSGLSGEAGAKALQGFADSLLKALSGAFDSLMQGGRVVAASAMSLASNLMDALSSGLSALRQEGFGARLAEAAGDLVQGLLEGISEALSGADFSSLMASLGQGLYDAMHEIGSFGAELVGRLFSQETLQSLYEAGIGLVNLLIRGIQAGLQGVGGLLDGLVSSILTQLGVIDPEAVQNTLDLGKALETAILTSITDSSGQIAHSARTALTSILFAAGYGTDEQIDTLIAGTGLTEIYDKVMAAVFEHSTSRGFQGDANLLQSIFEQAFAGSEFDYEALSRSLPEDFWQQALAGLTGNANLGEGSGFLNTLLEGLMDGLGEGVSQGIAGEMETLDLTAVKEEMDTAAADLAQAGSESLKNAGEEIVSALDTAGSQFAAHGFARTLSEEAGPAREAAENLSMSVVEPFLLTLSSENGSALASSYLSGLISGFEGMKESVKAAAQSVAEAAADRGKSGGQEIETKISLNLEGLSRSLAAARDLLKAFGRTAQSLMTEAGHAAARGLKEGSAGMAEAGGKLGESAAAALSGSLSESKAREIAGRFAASLRAGIQSVNLAGAAGALAQSALSGASRILTGAAGTAVGQAFAAGLTRGLAGGAAAASAAAAGLARSVIQTTRNVMAIHSPSREAMEIGRYYTLGLEEGMQEGEGHLAGTLKGLADLCLKDGLEPLNGEIRDWMDLKASGSGPFDGLLSGLEGRLEDILLSVRTLCREMDEAASLEGPGRRDMYRPYGQEDDREDDRQHGTEEEMHKEVLRQIQACGERLAEALNGIRVEMDGVEVGTLVAPRVSAVLAEGSGARRFG